MIELLNEKGYALNVALINKRCDFTDDSKIYKIFEAFLDAREKRRLYVHPLNADTNIVANKKYFLWRLTND